MSEHRDLCSAIPHPSSSTAKRRIRSLLRLQWLPPSCFKLLALVILLQGSIFAVAQVYGARAAPLVQPLVKRITGVVYVEHTDSTIHRLRAFADGTLTNQYYTDNGRNQIDQKANNKLANTIAIRFQQHDYDDLDVGSGGDFIRQTLICLDDPSTISGYSEDSCVAYDSDSLPYRVTQRTFTDDAPDNWVVMEFAIENTNEDPSARDLTGGKMLFMLDIDAAHYDIDDDGHWNEDRRLVYQVDIYDNVWYAMGISLGRGTLSGYGVEEVNYLATGLEKIEEMTHPTNPLIQDSDNAVSWLVADIPDLEPGEEAKLSFGICAKTSYGEIEVASELFECIDDIKWPSDDIQPCSTGPEAEEVFLPIVLKDDLEPPPCFRDDFSHSNSDWVIGSFEEADYSYEPNSLPKEYKIYSKKSNTRPTARSASPFGPFSQYTVQVNANWAMAPLGDEYGILFGIQGKDGRRVRAASSFYRFVVNTRGDREYYLAWFDGAHWHPVVGWKVNNTVIKAGTQTNKLQVHCYGSYAAVSVNGVPLWQDSLPWDCRGEVGVTSSIAFPSTKTDARFDNFEVCGTRAGATSSYNSETIGLVVEDLEHSPLD